jgi:hypothetical protein
MGGKEVLQDEVTVTPELLCSYRIGIVEKKLMVTATVDQRRD